jgi:hypothetical protein
MFHLKRRTALGAGATAVLVGAAVLAAAPAGATTTSGSPSAGAATVTATTVQQLQGYTTVTSPSMTSGSMTLTRGIVQCPTGTVPLGGGAVVISSELFVAINSSLPFENGWAVDLNNGSATTASFQVTATCAVQPAHYKIVQKHVANPAATQTSVSATCPIGTKPLGGGALSNSGLFVSMASSAPNGTRAWRISESNATGEGAQVTAFAVCGSIKGYFVAHGPVVSIPGQSFKVAAAHCPVGQVPLSGGVVFQTTSVAADVSLSSFGVSHNWVSYADNIGATPFKASSTVVCAAALE